MLGSPDFWKLSLLYLLRPFEWVYWDSGLGAHTTQVTIGSTLAFEKD